MNKLHVAIEIYRRLEEVSISNRQITGRLPESSYAEDKKSLEDWDLYPIFKDEGFQVEFALPPEQDAFFATSMDELLEAPLRQHAIPAEFYIANLDYHFRESSEDQDHPEIIKNYLDATRLATTLFNLADYAIKQGNPRAIFLHGTKLELSMSYRSSDLKKLNGLKKFIDDFVVAEIHAEQKTTIIKAVLIEMLKSNELDKLTLPCLMRRFTDFLDRVSANYQLYVSEFSFEKIRSQVEREKYEFTLKLNKTFSDIQNQLLAVPVALILVGSQMETGNWISLKNLTIWVGTVVFGLFMSLLVRNQRSTLLAIRTEMDSQWETIKNKHLMVSGNLKPHYNQLNRRYRLQKWFLTFVSVIVALSIAGSTAMLLYKSPPPLATTEIVRLGVYGGLGYITICLLIATPSFLANSWRYLRARGKK